MTTERMPSIYTSLQYQNCLEVIDWMKNTLGFTEHMLYMGDDDHVTHAELKFENGLVMVSSTSKDGTNWVGEKPGNSDTSLVARDRKHVEQIYENVKSVGTKIIKELQESDFGKYGTSYGFTCADPENNRWSIGTYQPMDRNYKLNE